MGEPALSLTHAELLIADKDYEKAAHAVNLVYVRDNMPGICRIKKGKGFSYSLENNVLKEPCQINRIRKLAIPPAWTEVWICPLERSYPGNGAGYSKKKTISLPYPLGPCQKRDQISPIV